MGFVYTNKKNGKRMAEEEELSEEELLSQWQDMAADEGSEDSESGDDAAADLAEGALPERILDQDEIDSLLVYT